MPPPPPNTHIQIPRAKKWLLLIVKKTKTKTCPILVISSLSLFDENIIRGNKIYLIDFSLDSIQFPFLLSLFLILIEFKKKQVK